MALDAEQSGLARDDEAAGRDGSQTRLLAGLATLLLLAGGSLLWLAAAGGGSGEDVVRQYHAAIERHDFDLAWSHLSAHRRAKMRRDVWQEGYRATKISQPRDLRVVGNSSDTVRVTCLLHYEDDDGTSGQASHRYELVREAGGWKIDTVNGK